MKKFIEYFISDRLKSDEELYKKAKFSVGFFLFVIAITIISFLYIFYLRPDDIGNIVIGIVLPIFLFITLYIFKKNSSFRFVAHLGCILCFLSVCGAPLATGGIYSPDLYYLIIIPLIGLIIGNYRIGLFYAGLVTLCILLYYFTDGVQQMAFRKMTEGVSKEYYLMSIMMIAALVFFLLFRNEKLRLLILNELHSTNKKISEANKEITDSINYAKRIQYAILPQQDKIKKALTESFILYRPKDIVSGDFYWFAEIGNKKLLAVADCTGHGVPGAFMSMIGTSLLNRIVNEKKVFSPSEILYELNIGIIEALKQKETETRDGMDIALICMEGLIVEYAAANRSLYLIRNSELVEYKPTKSAIGGYYVGEEKKFVNNRIDVQKNDFVYMSTDGYSDQFGGEKNKKLTTKNFKNLLVEYSPLSMDDQKIKLDRFLENWKGQQEQIDDVLVIGIKI